MKIKIIILIAFLGSVLLFSSCTPNKYELGILVNKSTLKYAIAPSSANPNDIVLTSLTPNVTPMWVTPYGQSIRVKDTINIPFPGTYKFVYGVESAGGFVQADTATVIIDALDQNAVSTPTVGCSYRWVWKIENMGNGFGC